MKLTKRLSAVANLIPCCSCIADIGTDHAYIPIYLIEKGKIAKAIAADINKGPLERAKKHIEQKQMADRVEVRLGNGLSVLKKHEVDGAVLAGMGGHMMQSVLGKDHLIAKTLNWIVLQPQNHISDLRIWLQKNKYRIEKEVLVEEKNQLYEAMYVTQGEMEQFSLLEAEVGITKGRYKDPLFKNLLEKLIKKRNFVIQGVVKESANEVNKIKRDKAIKEKELLEEILWKYLHQTLSK